MKTFSIQSGSNGNCFYYQSGDVKLLFDAGVSLKTVKTRLCEKGIHPSGINGLFISHDHSDHAKSIGIFQRNLGVPVFISRKTFDRVAPSQGKLDMNNIFFFTPGDTIDISHIAVQTVPTPHDGKDPSFFALHDGPVTTGIATDLGHCFPGLLELLPRMDVVFLESNYDEKMLAENPSYPAHVKSRIRGKKGHISNIESAQIIKQYSSNKLKHLVLSHLSENNNTPGLALQTHTDLYGPERSFSLSAAPRYEASSLVAVEL